MKNGIIKSYGFNQQEIIRDILILHNHGRRIHLDPCFSVGNFYKNGIVESPEIKSDINPLSAGVLKLDVRELPFASSSIKSVLFDPPFLISNSPGRAKPYKMCQRFGSFESVDELKQFYYDSLLSLQRVLKHGGLLIFKCQDFVSGRKQHLILPYICVLARELNFALRDLFVLLSRSRLLTPLKRQQHARKYHCYFLVLKNNKRNIQESYR